jgi:gluconate 5-dehydrogenase
MAEGLAACGAKVVLNGSNEARLAQSVDEMRAAGFAAEGACFDVTNETAICTAFDRFDAEGLEIDILANIPGIQFRKPMLELDTADWQRDIDVNLTSAFVIGREAAKRMAQRGSGKVINIILWSAPTHVLAVPQIPDGLIIALSRCDRQEVKHRPNHAG